MPKKKKKKPQPAELPKKQKSPPDNKALDAPENKSVKIVRKSTHDLSRLD